MSLATPTPASDGRSPLVHIVDDDAGVRQALTLLIETIGLRVQAWSDPLSFLDTFDRDGIGAILLDVRMPGLSGMSLLDRLQRERVDHPVILLTGHGTIDLCRRAFRAGALEFLEKPVDDERLIEALQLAIRTHVRTRTRQRADADARQRFAALSPRERDVLGLIIEGLTNKEIARALVLSPRTVETHRAHLFEKLAVASLAQLIRRYAELAELTDTGAAAPEAARRRVDPT